MNNLSCNNPSWKKNICSFDDRRDLLIAKDSASAIIFCAEHFISLAKAAIEARGYFTVALSGGSTPKAVFQLLASSPHKESIDWKVVKLFWSDERCVPPNDKDSNYHMAMEAGFSKLNIPSHNIFRMPADSSPLDLAAKNYEIEILKHTSSGIFDLVMLGMGEDGHTASLFPFTKALHINDSLVTPNFIPEKNTWRMTLTFDCINRARAIVIYALGENKKAMIQEVFHSPHNPDKLPIQQIGSPSIKALWILGV